jgi:hypothetical protein
MVNLCEKVRGGETGAPWQEMQGCPPVTSDSPTQVGHRVPAVTVTFAGSSDFPLLPANLDRAR